MPTPGTGKVTQASYMNSYCGLTPVIEVTITGRFSDRERAPRIGMAGNERWTGKSISLAGDRQPVNIAVCPHLVHAGVGNGSAYCQTKPEYFTHCRWQPAVTAAETHHAAPAASYLHGSCPGPVFTFDISRTTGK